MSVCPKLRVRQPIAMPFGASLSASLACCVSRCFRQFTCVGLGLQPNPPTALTLAVAETSSRWSPRPIRRRCIVLAASDTTVASRAGASRLLRTAPQVRLMVLSISNNYLSDFHVAPKQSARWSRRVSLDSCLLPSHRSHLRNQLENGGNIDSSTPAQRHTSRWVYLP